MTIPKFDGYQKFIEHRYDVIDKSGEQVNFILNKPQQMFMEKATGRDILLKARQEGFSTLISGLFTTDLLLQQNCLSVVIADRSENAMGLLEKPKMLIKFYEQKRGVKVPLKYNSKYELYNEALNSRYLIGTAENADFGRSRTIRNLHMSEAAYYKNLRGLLASALQAVTPNGRVFMETTANGFNEFKNYWDESMTGDTGFQPLFFPASLLYDEAFLNQRKRELGERLYMQEYPETPEEAFITSGEMFFDSQALTDYLTFITKYEQLA